MLRIPVIGLRMPSALPFPYLVEMERFFVMFLNLLHLL